MTARELVDRPARDRIRTDLDRTFIVEAAAGTGKTTELVARILGLLREGKASLDRIVAVTFTDKAAGEMKLRVRTELERARAAPDLAPNQRTALELALAQLEVAHIGTIHSLCSDLLRERPVEASVDPLFEVAADDRDRLFDIAFEPFFQHLLADPPEGVRRLLRRRPKGRDMRGPRAEIRSAGLELLDKRDFDGPWTRDTSFVREAEIDRVIDAVRAAAAYAGRGTRSGDYLGMNLDHIARTLEEIDRREVVRAARDYDGLEAELRELARHRSFRWKGSGAFAPDIRRQDVLAARDAAKAQLDRALERCDADLAACLSEELRPLVGAYEELLGKVGKIDFLDLLLRMRDLLVSDDEVRGELQRRFSYVLVDEFQDTDPLQAEIMLLLCADDPAERSSTQARPIPGKLFVVGDPKQSIYRFRRADVTIYEETKRRLVALGAEVLYLRQSFRGAESLQRAINAAFAPVMSNDPGDIDDPTRGPRSEQAGYVALEPHRGDLPNQPPLIALPIPRPYADFGKIVAYRIEESYPDAVAAFVEHLVTKSGFRVTERDREPVPVEARHICLLFKRFQSFRDDITQPYVRALEARRIPHVLVGGRSYHAREEVMAIRAALFAIEWPDDELSVFATLRGPFFSIRDDHLFAYREAYGSLHPLRKHDPEPSDERDQAVVRALKILANLSASRNRRPIADTVARFLDATRAHAGIAIWPTGEQSLANVLRVMDLARRFEAGGITSFRSFVERLELDAERGEVAEAPVVEEGTEGVRIMTVHRAKGLEFPIVILADPTAPESRQNPTRFVDTERRLWAMPLAGCAPRELVDHREEELARDREEGVRVAYVAATRARDMLVVPVCGDEPGGDSEVEATTGWLRVLSPVVMPEPRSRRSPRAAPGCPKFGDDTVVHRPHEAELRSYGAVAPGLHVPQAGDHDVVWWDPFALRLDVEPSGGLRQQKILVADEKTQLSRASIEAHTAWLLHRLDVTTRGSAPTWSVVTPTALAKIVSKAVEAGVPPPVPPSVLPPRDRPVTLEVVAAQRTGRPRGKRFGTLVHAILAVAPLDADAARIDRIATLHAKLVGASADELAAAKITVLGALAHPLMQRARAAHHRGDCRREVSVDLRQDDGTLLEGIVDLAFREKTGGEAVWTIVDYKTDIALADIRAQYEVQVHAYVRAIESATGERARGVLLQV